jgi:hypothetical protein
MKIRMAYAILMWYNFNNILKQAQKWVLALAKNLIFELV